MREVELKSVVDDVAARRIRLERAGATLTFAGRLRDLRYDDTSRRLVLSDEVLRLRVYETDSRREGHLDWKGPTRYEDTYKVRDEVSTTAGDPDALEQILSSLGFVVIRVIEREIAQYELNGAVIRFETYPRMDALVEVEGPPETIERAIEALGLPRAGFTTGRLPDFIADYERRTGEKAAVSASELRGDYRYRSEDA